MLQFYMIKSCEMISVVHNNLRQVNDKKLKTIRIRHHMFFSLSCCSSSFSSIFFYGLHWIWLLPQFQHHIYIEIDFRSFLLYFMNPFPLFCHIHLSVLWPNVGRMNQLKVHMQVLIFILSFRLMLILIFLKVLMKVLLEFYMFKSW